MARAFDLNWDNTGTASLQSNTFADVNFGAARYGLKIGLAATWAPRSRC